MSVAFDEDGDDIVDVAVGVLIDERGRFLLTSRPAGKVYFVSQLGKYLPGSVWGMVALVSLAARHRVPRRTSVAAGVINLVVSVATAAGLAALLLPFGAMETVRHFWYLALLLPVLLAGLHPQVVVGVLEYDARSTTSAAVLLTPSTRTLKRVPRASGNVPATSIE